METMFSLADDTSSLDQECLQVFTRWPVRVMEAFSLITSTDRTAPGSDVRCVPRRPRGGRAATERHGRPQGGTVRARAPASCRLNGLAVLLLAAAVVALTVSTDLLSPAEPRSAVSGTWNRTPTVTGRSSPAGYGSC
jgi:hypothetical protein